MCSLVSAHRSLPFHKCRFMLPNRHFLLYMPIALRLTLGFLLAALLAALVTWVIGSQHAATLSQQSNFYQMLFQINTNLTDGDGLLKSIDHQMTTMLEDAKDSRFNEVVIEFDKKGLLSLVTRYDQLLSEYASHDLLVQHPEQLSLLGGNVQVQIEQQRTYAAGALRTWQIYNALQDRVSQMILQREVSAATNLLRLQGEPALADTFSALHSLLQFNRQLATMMDQSANDETARQLILTLLGSFGAFLAVFLIGISLSLTLVRRLKQLHQITQAVEKGQTDARVDVTGGDEIADVSRSVNKMLGSLVEAIERTNAANQQLDQAYQQQYQLNELKNQLLQNVSHELRTPLTEIYGFLQLMYEHQEQLDATKRTIFLENALSGCEELLSLLNTVLDTAYIGTTTLSPQIENLALSPLVEGIVDQCDPRQREEHPIHLDVAPSLFVQADQKYLRQILRNLLSNAFKYTPAHTPIFLRAKSACEASSRSPLISICVQDTGPGIPLEEQAMLFQQFVRLKRDLSGTVRGTGLGLYLCRQLVEAMNGQIRVESSGIAGEGSTFWLTLPAISTQGDRGEEPQLHLVQDL